MPTGAYTTTANNNIYGTLVSQLTTGESYNRIYDPTNPDADLDGYALLTVGEYTTYAGVNGLGVVDGFATINTISAEVRTPDGEQGESAVEENFP